MTRVLIVDDERNIHKAYCADIQAAADRYELVDTMSALPMQSWFVRQSILTLY